MSAPTPKSVLSGRAQDRLSQLHRSLTAEMRTLVSQHSLVLGAIQACDLDTQSALLREYFDRLAALRVTVEHLHIFLGRHLASMSSAKSDVLLD